MPTLARHTAPSCNPPSGPASSTARPKFFPHLRQGTRALPYKVLRYRGRADRVVRPYKPFRRAGCPHPAAQPCTAPLAKTLSLRTSDRFTAVAIRPPSPKILFPSRKKGAPPPGRAPFQTDSIHQKSALPTVRGCSSTSRMLLTPVRYMTIRSKPRPKPACLQVP